MFESSTSNNSIEDGSFDQYRSDDSRVKTNKKKLAKIGRAIAVEDTPLPDLSVTDSAAKKDFNGNMKSAYLSDSSMNKYDNEDIDPSGDSTAHSSSQSTRTANSIDDSQNDSEVASKSIKKKLIIKSDSENDESESESDDDEDNEDDEEEEEEEEEESSVQPKLAKPVKKIIRPQDESILFESEAEKQNQTQALQSALNYRDVSAKILISDDEDVQEVDGGGSENDDDDENDEDYVVPKEERGSIGAERSAVQSKIANDSDIIDISDTPVKSTSNSTIMNESMKKLENCKF